MKKVLKNKKAFTLTEMIVVIAIIGILAGVLIPTITGYIKRANQSAAYQEAEAVLEVYQVYETEKEAGSILESTTFKEYYAEITENTFEPGVVLVELDGEGKLIEFYYNGDAVSVQITLAGHIVKYHEDAIQAIDPIIDLGA